MESSALAGSSDAEEIKKLTARQATTKTPFDIWTYLTFSIRPAGALIFIEAIAWFLLRQYRALIEDYKIFHRMYLKRANYLIAYRT